MANDRKESSISRRKEQGVTQLERVAAHSAQIMKENGSPTVGMDWVGLSAGLRVWTVLFFRLLPVLEGSAQILWSLAYRVADVRDEEAATGEQTSSFTYRQRRTTRQPWNLHGIPP